MTSARQTLTWPTAGYSQTVQAYLWGAGGGAGGNDNLRSGGAGTGGGYVEASFTVNPGDVIELTVGSGGWSGRASSEANDFTTTIFNTRTAVPVGGIFSLPAASNTYVARWSRFLNTTGIWNTGTAIDGSTTSLAYTLSFDHSYEVLFPFSIDYAFNLAAYYQATVYLDGVKLFESGLNSWKTQESGGVPFISNITAGLHTIRIVASANAGANYGLWGVGLTVDTTTNAGSGGGGLIRNVFDTRSTPASPPLTIPNINPLLQAGKVGSFSNLMNDFGMWESNPTAPTCSRTYFNVYFPYTGTYQIQMSAANTATLSIDGTTVYTTPGSTSYETAYTIDYTVSQGYHTVAFSASLSDPTIIGGVAIVISKSWSGATGGLAGPRGSSGGGGGSGGATTLVLNPKTVNETLLAVAVGGAGGGGAGATTTGQGSATAPGPRGRSAAGISSAQAGQNQGDLYTDGGGGGAGGPGGPSGAGKNGYSSEGDSYGQAGTVGIGYLNPVASGQVYDPISVSVAFAGPYHSLVPDAGRGAQPGQLQANHGGAVFVFTSFGPRIKDSGVWQEVKSIFVNVNGTWKQIDGMYVKENGVWREVVGTSPLTFEPENDDFGILSRPADHRPLPVPPPPPPPVTYDGARNVAVGGGWNVSFNVGSCSNTGSASCSAGSSCFVADTLVDMADGSTKKIFDVNIGDLVYNYNRTKVNRVLFIEKGKDSDFGYLYSPDQQHQPFATFNHPLYINGKLSTVDPEYMYNLYPWFGHTELIATDNTVPPQGVMTYNLWTDGDHTYVVNGYGTTSIVGDGGLLRLMVEQGLMSYDRANEVLISFVGMGKHIGYGLYVLNQLSGKLNIKPVNRLSAWVFNDDSRVVAKKIFFGVAKAVGVIACLFGPK